MDYQQLPPQSAIAAMSIGATPVLGLSAAHNLSAQQLQLLQNNAHNQIQILPQLAMNQHNGSGNNTTSNNLQILHNALNHPIGGNGGSQQPTNQTSGSNTNTTSDSNNNTISTGHQPLPPTSTLLQQLHSVANTVQNGQAGKEVTGAGQQWTQFQVQQLWRHHAYLNGKTSGGTNTSKDICGDEKFKEDGDPWNVEAQAAFLGPNLWEKTLPYDADLKYADLDEFLSENNIPDGLPGTHLGGHSTILGNRSDLGHSTGLSIGLGHITTKRERSPSPSDCISPDTINPPSPAESTFSFASSGRDFDPRTRAFSDEELKPQPMIKKSRKQFVPDELKDDKYWARRRKNNIAAKRSRDARRQKENQIAMRARYLEKENSTLHQELEQLKQENMELRARLSKYQDI